MAAPAPGSTARKIRVVVAKPGLDGHDRGAKIIARALRDAGMEVIYTGLHQTPEQIVETVIQEDADAVGLSILSGAHMTLVPRVVELLHEQDIDDVVVTVGGTIPADDIPELKRLGVAEVFTPGAPTQAIVDFIRGAVEQRDRPLTRPTDSSVNPRGTIRTFVCPEEAQVKICVLVKEVPDAAVEKRIDPSTGRMDRSGEKNLNPYDTHAIEAAMQIKEGGDRRGRRDRRRDDGPEHRRPRAAQGRLARRRPLRPPRPTTRLAGSDVAATGYALAQTLERESPDLVLLGQQSDDGECYTIGAVVADHLQMPSLTQVIKMDVADGTLRCERQAEYGYDTVEVELPAVISVGDAINEPRYPSLKAIMGAKKKPLETLGAGDAEHRRRPRRRRRLAGPVRRASRLRRRRPPARSSRTRTPTRRSRRSSPGSTRGS